MIYCVAYTVWPKGSCMAYGMAQRELYDLLYGPKRAIWPTIGLKESYVIYGMAQRELYD